MAFPVGLHIILVLAGLLDNFKGQSDVSFIHIATSFRLIECVVRMALATTERMCEVCTCAGKFHNNNYF